MSKRAFSASLISCLLMTITGLICAGESAPSSDASIKAVVRAIKVLPDRVADCTSLKGIVDTVSRGCKTNDEKAIAIYNFMRLTHYHRAYPSEPGGIPVLKEINCYGWSLCGGLHAEQSALWRELGWNWRFVGWPGHTMVEAYYDGRWHYLDVFLKFYAWTPDPKQPSGRTIAGQDDLAANPQELVLDAFVTDSVRRVAYMKGNEFAMFGERANWQAPAFLVCGDDLAGIVDGLRHRSRVGPEPGWSGINHATGTYSADVNLAPGFALTNSWDKMEGAWHWADSKVAPCHTCGDKEIRNSPEKGPIAEPYLGRGWDCESYANGQLTFRLDVSNLNCLTSFASVDNVKLVEGALIPVDFGKPGRVTVLLKSPYLMTQATGIADGADAFEVSLDGGKTWKSADLRDFGKTVGGQIDALVRLTFTKPLKNLSLNVTLQNNPFSLPYLSPGRNSISVTVNDPRSLGDNTLVVTYAYRVGSRRKSYEQLLEEDNEIARGHGASWEEQPTIVQKTFSARELPARFDIDIPTPKGKYPVYPRMLFVRREILSPNQKPLPLPPNSTIPKAASVEELMTLPNPFLTGIQAPPAKAVRPTTTVMIDLTPSHFVSKSGPVVMTDLLKWPKNDQEKVDSIAFLIGGELNKLVPAKDLVSARLVFPVNRAHDKAPTKVGITALKTPFVINEPFDFSQLGPVIGTVVVPAISEDVPSWTPPKEFKIDVTRQIRSVISGATKFHGFALRVVPDRGVDDGWTVRVQIPKPARITLEVEVNANNVPLP